MTLLSSKLYEADLAAKRDPNWRGRPLVPFPYARIGHYRAKHVFAIDGASRKSENANHPLRRAIRRDSRADGEGTNR